MLLSEAAGGSAAADDDDDGDGDALFVSTGVSKSSVFLPSSLLGSAGVEAFSCSLAGNGEDDSAKAGTDWPVD